jgi:hypothetical protein
MNACDQSEFEKLQEGQMAKDLNAFMVKGKGPQYN